MTAIVALETRRPVRQVASGSFFALGLVVSVFGPLIPGLRDSFGLSLGEVGLLALLNQLGYLVSVLTGGLAADRWGRRLIVLVGLVGLVLGSLALAAAPTWPLALAGGALLGLGSGFVDAPVNALINEHSGEHRGADLNITHAFFGLGAVVGPLLAGGLMTLGSTWRLLLAPAAVIGLVVLWQVLRLQLGPERLISAGESGVGRLLRSRVIGLFALMLGLYVGVELMIGTWAFSHLRLTFGADDAAAGVATALYWAGITVGRLLAGLFAARVTPHQFILGNAIAGLLALGLLVMAPSLPLAVVALTLVGIALANVFPAIIAAAGAVEPHASGAVTGLLIAAAALGGAVFPWLVGVAAEQWGLTAALAGGLVLLVLIALGDLLARAWARD